MLKLLDLVSRVLMTISLCILKGEANELRKQLQIARSLRSGSSPEFDEKMTRIRQLRDMRKEYLDKIQAVKSIRSGDISMSVMVIAKNC
jgi:uncharacterized coiled-coil DUF342 family protein